MSEVADRLELSETTRIFICGGLAGCCAKTTVAPLDRVKILLQAHSSEFETQGVCRTLRGVWRSEGFIGFYRGNGAQMLRIFPYSAIQFLSFDLYSKMLVSNFGQSRVTHLISGSLAGVTAVSATYPLDVVRSRLAFQRAGSLAYAGIADCLLRMWREPSSGRLRPFYVGYLPSVCGMVPYAGISFYTFDRLKRLALQSRSDWLTVVGDGDVEDDASLRTGARLLIGGLAGAVAQTVSYPLDSTRRIMQVSVMSSQPGGGGGMLSTLSQLYTNYGVVRGLYRGLTINYLRVVPMAAVSFTTFETLKQLVGVR